MVTDDKEKKPVPQEPGQDPKPAMTEVKNAHAAGDGALEKPDEQLGTDEGDKEPPPY